MVNQIFLALGISLGLNIVFFLIAFNLKKDLFTDITYASTYFILAVITMVINKAYGISHFLILSLVLLWSLRLGSYLFIRILKIKVDHRFDKMRNSFIKFGTFWILQGIIVWLVSLPTMFFFIDSDGAYNHFILIGFIIALLFLLFETIADLQKWNWIQNNAGKFIKSGLWSISRHPNYFGEYMFWLSVFSTIMIADYNHIYWIGLIGPIFLILTLYFKTGVPMLEKSGMKLWGKDKEYQEYLANTPCVIPYIGRKGYPYKK